MFKRVFSKKNYYLIRELVRTDFKLRYQGSVLGYLWTLLKPLLLFAILFTVFTKFLHIGKGVPNYPLSLLLGIVLWTFFVESTGQALKSVVSSGDLIRKISIPRYMVPAAAIISAFINMVLNLVVVFIFVLLGKNTALSWQTLWVFPLLLLELIALSVAVGLFLAAVYVKFRDLDHIWEVLRQALFYTIPIVFPLTLIPNKTIQRLIMMDPLAQIIEDARHSITYKGSLVIPDLFRHSLVELVPITLVFVALVIAVLVFKKESKFFAENV